MDECPEIIDSFDQKMSPLFKEQGYKGHYSNELRITKEGKAYGIDLTIRAPSPPYASMMEMYEDYPGMVWQIANGEMPDCTPKKDAVVCAEVILVSEWHKDYEMCVEFPKEIEPHVKLRNQKKDGDVYYVIPNKNDGFFGSAFAYGTKIDSVIEEAIDLIKQIKCVDKDFHKSIFDEAKEQIEAGRKFGIDF